MFTARFTIFALLVAAMALSACKPKYIVNPEPPSQPNAAALQSPTQPAATSQPATPDLNTATPEVRLKYLADLHLQPDSNFRDALSPLVKDAPAKYSQFYEELVIRDFFQDERDGVFLDVGCYHPIYISTTYYLEHHLGWSGYAIDAIAEHAAEWARERPKSKFFAYAITDHDGDTITFHSLAGGGTSSVHEKAAEAFGGESTPIQVPTITLNTLLEREGVQSIDFLSMDIEDSEPAALKGFDLQRFKPRLVCIENGTSEEKQKFLLDYFTKNGYERIDKYFAVDKLNWYFTPKVQK